MGPNTAAHSRRILKKSLQCRSAALGTPGRTHAIYNGSLLEVSDVLRTLLNLSLFIGLLLAVVTGCGSVHVQRFVQTGGADGIYRHTTQSPVAPRAIVYGGVTADAIRVSDLTTRSPSLCSVVQIPPACVSALLSVVADTLLLPVTVSQQVWVSNSDAPELKWMWYWGLEDIGVPVPGAETIQVVTLASQDDEAIKSREEFERVFGPPIRAKILGYRFERRVYPLLRYSREKAYELAIIYDKWGGIRFIEPLKGYERQFLQ